MPNIFDVVCLLIALACGIGVGFTYANTRPRMGCWHHNDRTGESWVGSYLIDLGRRKVFRCSKCEHRIVV